MINTQIKRIGWALSIALIFVGFGVVSASAQVRGEDSTYEHSNRGMRPLQIARTVGHRDGLIDGRDARKDRDRYNPWSSGDYKKATNGYESRFGSKIAYKNAYRPAYIRGYDQGFGRVVRRAAVVRRPVVVRRSTVRRPVRRVVVRRRG